MAIAPNPQLPNVGMPLVRLRNVTVRLGGAAVLEDITCDIRAGCLTALIGPNGSGKTTLLRAVLGLLPYDGEIELGVPRERIGYVPQRLDLDRSLPVTVAGFLAALSGVRPIPLGTGKTGRAAALDILSRVEAGALLDRPLGGLSGGELQRVMFAVAIAGNPQLLLLDEPAGGMDIGAETLLYKVIQDRARARGVGVVMVSHDLSVVGDKTDRVLCINRRLVCEGGPESILTEEMIAGVFGHGHGLYQHHHDHGAHEHGHDHSHDHGKGGGHGG